jgi:hypothetical protein
MLMILMILLGSSCLSFFSIGGKSDVTWGQLIVVSISGIFIFTLSLNVTESHTIEQSPCLCWSNTYIKCPFNATCDNLIPKVIVCAGRSIAEHRGLLFRTVCQFSITFLTFISQLYC